MNRSYWGRRGLLGLGSASVALGLGSGGLEPVTGTGSATVSSPITSGVIAQAFSGSSSTALVGPGASGSGAVSVGGSGSVPLAGPSAEGAGAQAFVLVGLPELGPTAGLGLGALAFSATGSAVLLPVEASGRMRLVILGRRSADRPRWENSAAVAVELRAAQLPIRRAEAAPVALVQLATLTIPHREAVMISTYRTGDTRPVFSATLKVNGTAIVIDPGATVTLAYRRRGTTTEVERTCTVVDAATGRVSYAWQSGELVEGVYNATVVVETDDGVESFPAGEIHVSPRV